MLPKVADLVRKLYSSYICGMWTGPGCLDKRTFDEIF